MFVQKKDRSSCFQDWKEFDLDFHSSQDEYSILDRSSCVLNWTVMFSHLVVPQQKVMMMISFKFKLQSIKNYVFCMFFEADWLWFSNKMPNEPMFLCSFKSFNSLLSLEIRTFVFASSTVSFSGRLKPNFTGCPRKVNFSSRQTTRLLRFWTENCPGTRQFSVENLSNLGVTKQVAHLFF